MIPRFRDLIEILAQYDVKHQRIYDIVGDVHFEDMLIRVDNKQPLLQRVDTLVHEAVHAHYHNLDIDASEERVLGETRTIMRRMYGQGYSKPEEK